ncbi:MAG: type II toxin-antitoxin system VapC family toxin [Candidatus Marinimicrobia bacterium]|nr:type II toxin-antitoxin system VapC family toxin [Candidatus Neomarinimicrobiota bacterium]
MNLVDSSGWLEYFADGKNSDFFSPAIEDTEKLIVSTINIYEVFKRVLQQRAENDALQAVAVMQQAQVVDVTSAIALFAARISCEIKLPMADSLILATAKSMDATLWTQDSDFKEIHSVKYIKK